MKQMHEPVEQDGYGLSCTACDWIADYQIEPGYGWAAHVSQATPDADAYPHGSAERQAFVEGYIVAHHHMGIRAWPRYRLIGGMGMVPDRKGQWVHVTSLGVKTWDLDPAIPFKRDDL